MTSGGLGRGAGVLRSAPWLPLLGGSAAAAALLGVAVLVHGSGFAPFAALLGLAACGGAAAYVLDEESAYVLDATPTSRGRRVAWRLLLVAVPGLVALAGLLGLDHLDGATHWLRLLPFAAASLAMGVGLAAGLRRDGAAPGRPRRRAHRVGRRAARRGRPVAQVGASAPARGQRGGRTQRADVGRGGRRLRGRRREVLPRPRGATPRQHPAHRPERCRRGSLTAPKCRISSQGLRRTLGHLPRPHREVQPPPALGEP